MKKIGIIKATILVTVLFVWNVCSAEETVMQVQLPFVDGGKYKCTQNSDDFPTHGRKKNGEKAKNAASTRNDLDFGMPKGTIVTAAADGKVTLGQNKGFGNYIKIDHHNGYFSLYAHLMDNGYLVSDGQEDIVAGQPIAFSGSTGNSTAPHLHFGVHSGSGVGISEKMSIKAREYRLRSNQEFEYLQENSFNTGEDYERDCYCDNEDGKGNQGNYYEAIPLEGLFSPFQCHALEAGQGILCWNGSNGQPAACDDGQNHIRYFQRNQGGFGSEPIALTGENVGSLCYPDNASPVNLYSYLYGTSGVGGGDSGNGTGDANGKGGDANVKEMKVSLAGQNDWHHELSVAAGTKLDLQIRLIEKTRKRKVAGAEIKYYLSAVGEKKFNGDASGYLANDAPIKIKPGNSLTEHKRNITVPSLPGTYYFYAIVKYPDDSNQDNNISSSVDTEEYAKVTVISNDLKGTSSSLSPSSDIQQGALLTFQTFWENPGLDIPKDLSVYYLLTPAGGADSKIGEGRIKKENFQGAVTKREDFSFNAPTPGNWRLSAVLDPDNFVKEGDKSNNWINIDFTVQNAPPAPMAIWITNPLPGETWKTDDEHHARWQTQSIPASEHVKVQIKLGGRDWENVDDYAVNDGSKKVELKKFNIKSDCDAQIRIISIEHPEISVVSEVFHIDFKKNK